MADIESAAAIAAAAPGVPVLRSLSLPTTVVLASTATLVPLLVGETEGASRLDRITIQLDHAIPLVQQVWAIGRGIPASVTTVTDTIVAFLPTEYHAYSAGTFFGLNADGANFLNLAFGVGAEGTYKITGMTLTGVGGDTARYTAADLTALGATTSFTVLLDRTAPTLLDLSVPAVMPVLNDQATGPSIPYVYLGVAYGEGRANAVVHLIAPDGSRFDASPAVSGYSRTFTQTQVNVAGVYRIAGVDLTDAVGNATHYTATDLTAMGVTTSFTVLQQGSTSGIQPPGFYALDGTPGPDSITLGGNIGDYKLSRGTFDAGDSPTTSANQVGDFVMTATNGSGAYSIAESIETVRFQNGQYLALKDLPAYVAGSAAMNAGYVQDDLLFQVRRGGYEAFIGGDGTDHLYLNGNVADYTLRRANFQIYPEQRTNGGIELISKNGSGALFIGSSVEVIQFQNGQYLAYQDLGSYVAAEAAGPANRTYFVPSDTLPSGIRALPVGGYSNTENVVLLNGIAGDYLLSRGDYGVFVLSDGKLSFQVPVSATVQFGDGQYLATRDLPSYVRGDPVSTVATAYNDLLFLPRSGDQYVRGEDGVDDLYLNGNTRDYSLHAVHSAATVYHPRIDGYELVATNGSGNIYIDASTEVIHFQNGQYLAFGDLPAYVDTMNL